jgi:hypothetical protein
MAGNRGRIEAGKLTPNVSYNAVCAEIMFKQ